MNSQSVIKSADSVAYSKVILPFIEEHQDLIKMNIPLTLQNDFRSKMLEELSSHAEVTLQFELDNFVKAGKSNFDEFVLIAHKSLFEKYPVLNAALKKKSSTFYNHILKITQRFQDDLEHIIKTFCFDESENLQVTSIEANIGDGHNGEGTALLYLSNKAKLIYKPRNVEISNSYNTFIDWINYNSDVDLKTFKVLNKDGYGWLEYVEQNEVHSEDDLQEYYYKAGALLAITLFLGSKDYHRENIIASGKQPVLIDHETIIQPFLENNHVRSWDKEYKIPHLSVLESALIINPNTGVPADLAGFGISGQIEITEMIKKLINPNTIESRRVTRFVKRNLAEGNIPKYNGTYIFPNRQKGALITGFSTIYDLFRTRKKELKSQSTPLETFKNKEIRYVWRPTFVYYKILQYLKNPAFMLSAETYQSKLYELLSKAYREDHMVEYRFMLDLEMEQMLAGDIPIFNLHSDEHTLAGNNSFKVFKYSSLENMYNRLDQLSELHKNEQLNYIERWLNFKQSVAAENYS